MRQIQADDRKIWWEGIKDLDDEDLIEVNPTPTPALTPNMSLNPIKLPNMSLNPIKSPKMSLNPTPIPTVSLTTSQTGKP